MPKVCQNLGFSRSLFYLKMYFYYYSRKGTMGREEQILRKAGGACDMKAEGSYLGGGRDKGGKKGEG